MSTQTLHLSFVRVEKIIDGFALRYRQRVILRHSAETPVCGSVLASLISTCFAVTSVLKISLTRKLR